MTLRPRWVSKHFYVSSEIGDALLRLARVRGVTQAELLEDIVSSAVVRACDNDEIKMEEE
jgi:hypothetical protein